MITQYPDLLTKVQLIQQQQTHRHLDQLGPVAGVKGDPGAQGVKGDQGPAGPQGNPGPAGTISDNSVTTSKLADGAVTTSKIANDSITADKMSGVSKLSIYELHLVTLFRLHLVKET